MRFAIVELPHTFPLTADPHRLERALHWQDLESHRELKTSLDDQFDGYAVSVRFDGKVEHLEIWGSDRFALWTSRVTPTKLSGSPQTLTEALVVSSPRPPLYDAPFATHAADPVRPGASAKPPSWIRWALAHLGAVPGEDEIISFFTQERVTAFDSMLTLEAT